MSPNYGPFNGVGSVDRYFIARAIAALRCSLGNSGDGGFHV